MKNFFLLIAVVFALIVVYSAIAIISPSTAHAIDSMFQSWASGNVAFIQ